MKLCKDILKDTSSSKIAFNTLYENYIALVKKKRKKEEKKDLYYVDIIKLYVTLLLQILLLYIELLPVEGD